MFTYTASPWVNPRDLFDTKPAVAAHCIGLVSRIVGECPFDTVIDPSAGAGAFSRQIDDCLAIDIAPRADNILQHDFLSWKSPTDIGRCLVLGNPPFGKNASLAVQFFNHAATFADVIAFIVPKTFRKLSLQARLSEMHHLVHDEDIAPEAFVHFGKSVSVPCAFQIWQRRDHARPKPVLSRTHPDFDFCDRDAADLAIQRVGTNAGKLKTSETAGSPQSHYFLKAVRCTPEELWQRFETIDFDSVRFATAGNPSIARTELVTLYDSVLTASHVIARKGHRESTNTSCSVELSRN